LHGPPENGTDATGDDIEVVQRSAAPPGPDSLKEKPRINLIKEESPQTIEFGLLDSTMTFLFVTYMLARLSLFLQAIVLLRQQPSSVFFTVTWTKFIPHISTFS